MTNCLFIQHRSISGQINAMLSKRIMSKNHIVNGSNLDPFVAFGLFFTSQAISVHLASRSTDPTINLLYRISLDVYTNILEQNTQFVNEPKQLNDILLRSI